MNPTLSRITKIVASVLGHDPQGVLPDERMSDLGAEDDDFRLIRVSIDDEWGFTLPVTDESTCQSIADWLETNAL